jgi:tetratricopeptide (TPR) repeat protein
MRRLAQALFFSDQPEKARDVYEQIVASSDTDVEAHLRLSQIYRQLGDFESSRKANDKALSLDPNNIEIQYNDVNLLEDEGKTNEAVEKLQAIIKDAERTRYTDAELTNRTMLIERLGMLQRTAERYDEAVETFQMLEDMDPSQGARSAAQIVETYRMARQFEKARETADIAYERFPESRMLTIVRASLLADLGDAEEAVRDMERFIANAPDYQNYLTLAQIYEKLKDFERMGDAIDKAEQLAATDEQRENIAFMRGAMYERLKDYAAAEEQFRNVLKVNPNSHGAMNYLGYMLADRNVRLDEAYELIKQAVDMQPTNAAYLDSLGWVYYRQGKYREAEVALKQALQGYSQDPTIHDHLGDVYFAQGRLKEAVQQWEIAIEAWQASAPSDQDKELIAKVSEKLERAKVSLAQKSAGKQSNP